MRQCKKCVRTSKKKHIPDSVIMLRALINSRLEGVIHYIEWNQLKESTKSMCGLEFIRR